MVNRTVRIFERVAGALAAALLLSTVPLRAGPPAIEKPSAKAAVEDDYYKLIQIPIPESTVLECGGFETMPDGKLAVSTRRGDIYLVEGAFQDPPANVKFTKWATGLHESLGLAYNAKDGFLYAIQRGEITRLKDTDHDGKADVYETYCDEWSITGDYHEYPFMSKFDKDGNLYVLLCLTGSFNSDAPWRGWCMKITPDGKMHPFASGVRSPGGVAFNEKGELFYTDNQGPWNGTSSLKFLTQGSFQGHVEGNKWYSLPLAKAEMGPRPKDPKTKSRIYIEAAKIPEFTPPPIWLPHAKVGQSSSGIICDTSGGKFGMFTNQMFVADQHHSNITRCVLEKVKGKYQGVAIPFRTGFASGIVPMMQANDGSFIVGGTNRGWGSVGPKEYALERLAWTGKTPFEIFDMKLKPDGFDLTFTEAVDKLTADKAENYNLATYRYIYQADYGSPEVDQTKPTVKSAVVSDDGKTVHLAVDGLQIGAIHELHVDRLRAKDGERPLLHPVAYYTLWNLAEAESK